MINDLLIGGVLQTENIRDFLSKLTALDDDKQTEAIEQIENIEKVLGCLQDEENNNIIDGFEPEVIDNIIYALELEIKDRESRQDKFDEELEILLDLEEIRPEDLVDLHDPKGLLIYLNKSNGYNCVDEKDLQLSAKTQEIIEKLKRFVPGREDVLEEVVDEKAMAMADVATSLQQVTERLATAVQDQTATLADLVAQVANGGRTSH